MGSFPIDEMCAVVQYKLIYSLNTGENSCLEVTNFAPRSIQGKDDASSVGEGDLSSEGWHCRCVLSCESYFVGWSLREGGGEIWTT
jgi:hypothetical protein